MSLLRLLTSGKSLVGISDATTRYRMSNPKVLPKFESANNPFRSKGGPQPVQSTASPQKESGRSGIAGRVNRWTAQVDAWLSRVRTKRPRAAIPQFSKPPVQGELSLDQIKVVRNDLSDSDLEVVPAKSPTIAAPSTPVSTGGERVPATPTTWGQMATQVFGVGKT